MQQVVQSIRNGKLSVRELPEPMVRPGHVLIANAASVISAGTERAAIELARKSLVGKARERPDHVRRVLDKLRQEGLFQTIGQVRAKLDEPMALGYSSAGVVLACGAGVQELKPGDRVASNGPHAGVVSVPRHLCARVADEVPLEHAAFATIGAIALQGVRLARVGLGETVFVIGLGLVGQFTVALLRASGCRVLGTDLDRAKCDLALRGGAEVAAPSLEAKGVAELTGGLGADAVLVTAATPSNQPIELAAEAVRQKGRVVAVGAVGLDLPRRPFYFKEAELVVSCSYGPGRYDPTYEERGHDYPAGYVRWTEQRNLQAIVDLVAQGRLDPGAMITHRFDVADAPQAYALIEAGSEPYLGIVLRYPEVERPARRNVVLRSAPHAGRLTVGCLGAGNFARAVLLPAITRDERIRPRLLCAPGALSADHTARRLGFEAVTTDEAEVLDDPEIAAVFVATRHDQHARQVLRALRAGKHVFVEKPLALTVEEIDEIEAVLAERGEGAPLLMVGFNRRFSPAARAARDVFAGTGAPLAVSVRFNAGAIPAEHWTQDEEVGGGRLVGEACHGIDLATYLTGAVPVRVSAESVEARTSRISDDQAFITLRHANGSVSSVAYLSGGDRSYPKERVEIFGGGRVAVIDDFRGIETARGGKRSRQRTLAQDKGHAAELRAFADAVIDGGAGPIPWAELRAVSLAAILAVRSLREGMPFEL